MPFAKDSLRTFAVRCSVIVFGVLSSVINARWLGPEGVGIIALFILIGMLAIRFGELGYKSSLIFFIAQKKISIVNALKIAIITSVFMIGGCCVVILLIYKRPFSPWLDFPIKLIYLSLLSIIPIFVQSFFVSILRGALNIKAVNIASLIRTFCYISALVIFVILLNAGVIGAVCAIITSDFVSLIYLMLCIKKQVNSTEIQEDNNSIWKVLIELWHYGRWNYLRSLIAFLYSQMPVVILKWFHGNEVVGIFSVSKGLIMRVLLLPKSFSENLFAYTSASQEEEAAIRTNTTCRIFSLVSICVSVFVALTAKPIILFLYGDGFATAISVIYCFLPWIIFLPFYQFFTEHFAGFGKPYLPFILRLVVLPVFIMLYYFFIPRYGAVGAAVAQSLLSALLTILSLIYYKKLTNTKLAVILLPQKEDLILCKKLYHDIVQNIFKGSK